MSDKLKSAFELAMEKLQGQPADSPAALSTEQKTEIAELRGRYRAKIAEAEIASQSSVRRAVESGAFDDIEGIQQRLISEKARLNREMEEEVSRVREGR